MLLTYLVYSGFVLYALQDALRLSNEIKPRVHGLTPTFWSASSNADLDDGQWRHFRGNLGTIFVIAALQLSFCRFAKRFGPQCKLKASLACGLALSIFLHGPSILFLLMVVLTNYAVARLLHRSRALPLVTWIGNLSFLVVTEYYGGYKLASLGLPKSLDDFPILLSWHSVNNLGMLKVVSFTMDYYWSSKANPLKTVRLTLEAQAPLH
jgi:hypothetical protein